MLASFSRRDLLRTPGLAEKYLLELLGRCSSHCDACNRQVGEPVESSRFACTATPLPKSVHKSAGTFPLLLLGTPKLVLLPST